MAIAVDELSEFLCTYATGDLLPWSTQHAAAERFCATYGEIEGVALELGLLPARYQRNRQTISTDQQYTLFKSRVAIIGCGGLGGYVIEELSRLGVGNLVVVDPDIFEEHNLNRQILSSHISLGLNKVDVAAERVWQINPAVNVIAIKDAFSPANGAEILDGADVVVDALDSISTRQQLADSCGKLQIPLVHGSIAGWYGHVTTQFPGDDTLNKIYRRCGDDKGIERIVGNPSFTPAVVASLEVAEVCKILLNYGTPLRKRMLHINLLDMQVEEIPL